MKKVFFSNKGFTLIELLMVVIILGILAAVVIPQFSSSSKDAKESVLKSNLAAIRGALELYSLQHSEQYPTGDPNVFVKQLTQYTDKAHDTSDDKKEQPDGNFLFPYGPYLKTGFPKNPFHSTDAQADKVNIDDTITTIGTVEADEDPTHGWKFVLNTGEFIANTPTSIDTTNFDEW